jgi:hypothetical protein
MTQQEFQQIAHTIPLTPGIYKYYDLKNELLYVGKAKSFTKNSSSIEKISLQSILKSERNLQTGFQLILVYLLPRTELRNHGLKATFT